MEEQTEEERTYVALAAIYKNDKDCKVPPLEGWTSDQMSVTDWFDRIRRHNQKYALSRWLKNAVPDRLDEIQGDINLKLIKRNLRHCEGPIADFEELEKTLLAKQKQDQYNKQVEKLITPLNGRLGMVHILIQCQVDDDTVNALQELGLADEGKFVKLLDLLEDLKEKVPPSHFDSLVAAATWMKENPDVPSESYKSEFTDEVLASQLELLHEKREVEEREQELKNAKQWSHILSICGLKGDGRDLLIQSEVASVKDLLSLPESIAEFKRELGPFGRKWYSGSEMMKKARMTTKQMGNGWFEDTVTDNLFLCCRIIKNDSTPDVYTSLTRDSIESKR